MLMLGGGGGGGWHTGIKINDRGDGESTVPIYFLIGEQYTGDRSRPSFSVF